MTSPAGRVACMCGTPAALITPPPPPQSLLSHYLFDCTIHTDSLTSILRLTAPAGRNAFTCGTPAALMTPPSSPTMSECST